MSTTDLTIAILTDIRDEIRVSNTRLASLEAKADVTNVRLESLESNAEITNARLGMIEHTLVDFGTQVVFASRVIRNVERRHDAELAELRDRVTKLERDE